MYKALFLTCATINSVYCCKVSILFWEKMLLTIVAVWDLAMDWSEYMIPRFQCLQLIHKVFAIHTPPTPSSAKCSATNEPGSTTLP